MEKLSLRNKYIPVAIAVLLMVRFAVCGSYSAGMPDAPFRAGTGATAMAFGNAWAAFPEYLAAYWNPAVPVMLRGKTVACGGGLQSLGRTAGFVEGAFMIPPRGALSASAIYHGDPFITGLRDAQENEIPTVSYTNILATVGGSYAILRTLSAGISLNILYTRLPDFFLDSVHYTSVAAIGGINMGICYMPAQEWTVGLVVRNLNLKLDYQIKTSGGLDNTVPDTLSPQWVGGVRHTGMFCDYPFVWNAGFSGFIVDGGFAVLDYPEVTLGGGFEWQRWQNLYLRLGIGDVPVNRDVLFDQQRYGDYFACTINAGASFAMPSIAPNARLNYTVGTDKVWAGVNQQLDIVFSFK